MADIQSNIQVNIDTTEALASLRNLQRQISAFHTTMAKGGQAASIAALNQQQNLINAINATGKFSAEMQKVSSTTENFTQSLEKNKFSMREYFRYAGASTKTFGRLFTSEFDTINKVARERVKDLQTQYIKMGRDANGSLRSIAVRPLALDMDNLGTKTAIAAQRQQLLNQLLKQGSTNLLNFGKNTQWAGRQLMVGFSVPLMYLGTTASRTFMQLEEQAIRFKRVYGEIFTTQEETDAMLNQIKTLASQFTKYGVAVADTMAMAADAAASGKMGADLIAQVNEATRLSILGQVEQQQALETTISITNAFGVASDQLRGKINFLNAVENQTVVSIEDLTTAIPKAGPVVKQLGGDVEDLAYFLTAMKEGGINASEGANALKSGLAALINPTKKASDFLAGFGINIKAIVEGSQGDIKKTVIDFASALNTLDPLNRSRAIEQLFGKFQFARISTLFENVTRQGTQASRVLELTRATTEELAILSERELKRVEDSPMYKFKKTIEDLKVSIAPIGAEFLKAITPIAEFFKRILDGFNNFSDGTKKTVVILTTALAGIGPVLLMTFGLLANGLANIIKLFAALRGGYASLGKNSNVLGEQTSYMSSEQIRAAAVAASLNQTHSTLIQTFTSEASAIDALANAYTRATAQQRNFTGLGVAGSTRTRKYAGGILSVPGPKGAGDIVPSMLSPGESVIPTKQTEKYKGLIQGIIADNIPGFATGRIGIGKGFKNATMYTPESWNTLMGGTGKGIETAQLTAYFEKAGSAAMAPLMAVMAKSMGMKINDPKIKAEWSAVGSQLVQSVTNALNTSGKEFIKDEDLENIIVPELKQSAKNLNVAGQGLSDALDKSINEIHTVGQVGTQSGTSKGAGRTALDRLSYRNVRDQSQLFAMTENPEMFARNKRVGSSGKIKNTFQTFNTQTKNWEVATMAHITKSITTTVDNLIKQVTPYLGDQSAKIIKATTKAVVDGAKSELKVASPSREARRVGQETGRGFIIGAQESVGSAKTAGMAAGTAVLDIASQSRSRLYGQGPIDPAQKSIRRQLEKQARLQVIADQSAIRGGNLKGIIANGGITQPESGIRSRLSGIRPQGAMMGAAGIATFGSMAPGAIGDLFQKLVGPMMALSFVLPLLTSPMGAVAVGLGALAAVIIKSRMAFDKAQNSAMDLAEATGSGSKAIKQLSMFANKVSSGEIMSRRRENALSLYPVQTGKTSFGENFAKSDQGKSLISSIGQSMKTSGRGMAQSQLITQLASGIASGAIDPAQARSIASSIGKELGDYTFGIQVNAKMIDLVGVNGENLSKDPLSIRIKLIEDSRAQTGSIAAGLYSGATKYSKYVTAGKGSTGYISGSGNNNIAAGSGALVEQQKNTLQLQQEMLDAFDLEYEKKLEIARLSKDQVAINKVLKEQEDGRQTLLNENAETLKSILETYKNSDIPAQKAIMTAVDKSITRQYKGTGQEQQAAFAKSQIDDSKASRENQLMLKMQLGSGQMGPAQIINLIDLFGSDNDTISKIVNLTTKIGGANTNQALSILQGFQDKNGNPNVQQQKDFIANINALPQKDAQKYLDLFTQIRKVGEVTDLDVNLNFYNKNNGAEAKNLQSIFDKIAAKDGKFNSEVDIQFIGKEALSGVLKDAERFFSLPADQQKTYLMQITTIANMSGDNAKAIQDWIKSNPGKTAADYYAYQIDRITKIQEAEKALSKNPLDPGITTPIKSSPVDDLIKKLKELRKLQIDLTQGWSASMGALKSLYGKGGTVGGFSGLEQQMRSKGANQQVIDFVTGMTLEEYKTYKNQLFEFDKKGNITKLKDAEILQRALNDIAVGDYQNSREKVLSDLKNQSIALNILTSAGMSAADAYEAVGNSALAASIASGKTITKDIQNIKKLNDEIKLRNKLEEQRKEYATAQQNILDKEYVAATSAGFSAASKYFELQEQIIQHAYQGEIDKQQLIIDNANISIRSAQAIQDANNYQISRYDYNLQLISDKATEISDRYSEQFTALDKISKLNSIIAKQEQARLTVADAITQGDIAAAAKAAADMRAQNAQDAIDAQRTSMEKERDAQIAALTDSNGLTKTQIEEKINSLKQANAKIDYDIIAPLQEQSRIAGVQLQLQTDAVAQAVKGLSLAGQTKQQWEWMSTQIQAAEFATGKYDIALQAALQTAKDISGQWDSILAKLAMYAAKLPELSKAITGTSTSTHIAGPAGSGLADWGAASYEVVTNPYAGTMYGMTGRQFGGPIGVARFATGGSVFGTDVVPAMLTPGEFIVSKPAVDSFGMNNLKSINDGTYGADSSVYNYSLSVNVSSDANPDEIARTVIAQIKKVDAQRVRGNRL